MKAFKLKAGDFEIKVKAKDAIQKNEEYNKSETEYFLNHLVVVLQEAAHFNRGKYDAVADAYEDEAREIYEYLKSIGAYDFKMSEEV